MERPEFSEMLSERRRELGYSIGQASRVLRLREDVLIAFEEGDFDGMPKSGYAQGMLSSYARYLGLDAGVVIEAYIADYDAYKREIRRGGRGRSADAGSVSSSERNLQPRVPRVPSKGLLPTSGGYAGDMGSFATTRVHVRMHDSEGSHIDEGAYPQGRRYTSKAPMQVRHGSGGDIQTLDMDYSQYDDDLRIEREATPYAAASSQQGRRRTAHGGRGNRPQVNRRSTNRTTRTRRNGVTSRNGGSLSLFTGTSNKILVAIAAIAVALVIVVVISVGSYVNKSTPPKSVPVTTSQQQNDKGAAQQTTTEKQGADTTKADGSKSAEASGGTRSNATNTKSDAPQTDVNVTVTVANGAVTWLEISNDGKSEIAETVTGPWNKSFRVQEAITIQAGDTSVVTVLQDGKQVQFESMASGIGTIRIQGPGKKVPDKDKSKQDDQSETTGTEEKDTGETSSAKMGNESSVSTQSNGTSQTYDTTSNETDSYSYGYDSAYEYNEYSNGYSTDYTDYSYDYSQNGY